MSTELTWSVVSRSAEETEALGAKLGSKLRGGEVIELVSDLGGGKTTFVRGLARGMGSEAKVASPTFTLSREYKAGRLTLYHFDFYRLSEPGIMTDELAEIVGDPKAVVVVEWGDIVEYVLPAGKMTISFKVLTENERELTFTYPKLRKSLIPKKT
jgi:tRNA threonylcarbamoyladenosine biosynthesis protein TsaE